MSSRHARTTSAVDKRRTPLTAHRVPDLGHSTGKRVATTCEGVGGHLSDTGSEDDYDDEQFSRYAFRPPTPIPAPTLRKLSRLWSDSEEDDTDDDEPVTMDRRHPKKSLSRSVRFGTLSARTRDDAYAQAKARLDTVVAGYNARMSRTGANRRSGRGAAQKDDEDKGIGCGLNKLNFAKPCFGCTVM